MGAGSRCIYGRGYVPILGKSSRGNYNPREAYTYRFQDLGDCRARLLRKVAVACEGKEGCSLRSGCTRSPRVLKEASPRRKRDSCSGPTPTKPSAEAYEWSISRISQ